MTRPTIKFLYVATRILWGVCTGVVAYYAFWRSGRGPWGFYLLGGLGCGAVLRKLHALRKRPDSISN
jgi:hypothetical protein